MKLLLAVSGGIDSMCLAEKVRLDGGPFALAHCNFGLRGADSDADEALVREWAARYGVPCHVKRFETRAYAARKHISIEMAARELRYRWFGQLCREFSYDALAVAHNANDNAETLILNLLRGTGIKGLAGMQERGLIPLREFRDITLLRPLLGMTRADIESFAREHSLAWREDATNALSDYKRNKIRNLVFPVFKEINPSFVQTLNSDMRRFAQQLAASGQGLTEATQEAGSTARVSGSSATTESQSILPLVIAEEPWDGTLPLKQPQGMLILDADRLEGGYIIGRWESGDWIKPLGAPGRKKMQDWFTDHHIPAWEKALIPLVKSRRDPHHVLAVAGHCIDNGVKVGKSTRRILRISIKND